MRSPWPKEKPPDQQCRDERTQRDANWILQPRQQQQTEGDIERRFQRQEADEFEFSSAHQKDRFRYPMRQNRRIAPKEQYPREQYNIGTHGPAAR